ncbi:MAG TPA: ATP12 family protein, partial [Allosphingosinicella sp.]|nr:ATP12 family protein [Allosphingosinicella sp.]
MADARSVKRFYRQATASPRQSPAGEAENGAGHRILLDGRPVWTPGREPLIVPTQALADEIAAEWDAQGERVDPRTMPLTGLANASIDRVAPDPEAFARGLAAYGEADLLCYRAEAPASLVAAQAEHWDPLLGWARRRFGVDFEIVSGIMHRPQPRATVEQLAHAAAARSAFELAALAPLVTIGGSLIIGLALADEAIDPDSAWAAATVDETYQARHWG